MKARPDFKCKNVSCGGLIWPPKDGARNTAPRGTGMEPDGYEPPVQMDSGPLFDDGSDDIPF